MKKTIINFFKKVHYFLYPAPFVNQKRKFEELKRNYVIVLAKNLEHRKELKKLKTLNALLEPKIEELKLKIKVLIANQNLKVCPYKEAKYWNEKRPYKEIVYSGRYMPNTDQRISIPVQLFIASKDPTILKDLENHGLVIKNHSECNKEILAIYKHTRVKPLNRYRYASDEETVGVPEFWFFPFELRFAKAGDCDDYGNELASYLIAAGVPRFRVRCVAGKTFANFGHLTVYVLGDDLKTWYHLNSTTPITNIIQKKLEDFPKSNESTDLNGIKTVWFSYNDKNAWSEFETNYQEKDFKKTIKDVKII